MEETTELVPRMSSSNNSSQGEEGVLRVAVAEKSELSVAVESPMENPVTMHLISPGDNLRTPLSPRFEMSPQANDNLIVREIPVHGSGNGSTQGSVTGNGSSSGGGGGAAAASSLRVVSLDGLRGIAAAAVMISHCLLITPDISDVMLVFPHPSTSWYVYLFAYTTLHILWAGAESVMLFFVLSGYVLCLPVANGKKTNWWAYYPSRLVRLYVPLFAATLFAYILLQMTRRGPDASMSVWMSMHLSSFSGSEIVRTATVVAGTNWLNSVFWSLQWEMIFSLLLPIYVWGLIYHKPYRWAKLLLLMGLILASEHVGNPDNNPYVEVPFILKQLPLFGIGAWMAQQRPWIQEKMGLMNSWPTWAHWVWHVCMWTWLMIPWYLNGRNIRVQSIECLFQVPPIVLIVAWTAFTEKGRSLGNYRLITWLGSRSFSIYLLHEPIAVTIGYAMHSTNGLLVLIIVVPTALVTSELFYRVVEQPAHKLSRWINKFMVDRTRPKATAHAVTA